MQHDYRLISFDFRVISHVLNSSTYEKPWQTRSLLSRWFGQGIPGFIFFVYFLKTDAWLLLIGVFSAEGAHHRQQVRMRLCVRVSLQGINEDSCLC